MRILFKLFLWLLILGPLALLAIAWLALSNTPLVQGQGRLSRQAMARAQAILRQNDPRRVPTSVSRQVELSAHDLDLAANYLLQPHGAIRVSIRPGVLDAVGSVRVPQLPLRPYLNIRLQLLDQGGQVVLGRLRIGALPIPAHLAGLALSTTLTRLYHSNEYRLARDIVQRLKMGNGYLQVTYRWDPELIRYARASLLNASDRSALDAYHARLLQLQDQGIGRRGSLAGLLQPLFAYAAQRSGSHDPVAENRALLTLLGVWASHKGLDQLFPDASRQPGRFRLTLERRIDLGQHFLSSAALAAQGDAALSDAVGVLKEIADVDGGSGFSFTDLAADRAGTRLGELATRSPGDARLVQRRLAAGIAERVIMPAALDLPEHLSAAQFERRYGTVGSSAYNAVMREIEQRIASCPIYRALPATR